MKESSSSARYVIFESPFKSFINKWKNCPTTKFANPLSFESLFMNSIGGSAVFSSALSMLSRSLEISFVQTVTPPKNFCMVCIYG